MNLEEFFEGVDETRQFLDRHFHDSTRQVQRLKSMARSVLAPRDPYQLARWLGIGLSQALGTERVIVLLKNQEWETWFSTEDITHRQCEDVERALDNHQTSLSNDRAGSWLYKTSHTHIPIGIYLEFERQLAVEAPDLLKLILETASSVMDSSLKIEEVSREPGTGLLPLEAFKSKSQRWLDIYPLPKRAHTLVTLRLDPEGITKIFDPLRGSTTLLQSTLRTRLPLGSFASLNQQTLYIFVPDANTDRQHGELNRALRLVESDMENKVGIQQPVVKAGAFSAIAVSRSKISALLDKLEKSLEQAPPLSTMIQV